LIAELPRTLFRGTNVLAIFGRHANRFASGIDLCFGGFEAGFQFANLVIERQQRFKIHHCAAIRKSLSEEGGILTQGSEINHGADVLSEGR
jgi:hypothetical protein